LNERVNSQAAIIKVFLFAINIIVNLF